MAEYFPLLDRAVSGLTDPTVEARRSIYERARTALIGQLRRMDPPIPEEDIARESAALDEAIARVEAGFAAPVAAASAAAPSPIAAPSPMPAPSPIAAPSPMPAPAPAVEPAAAPPLGTEGSPGRIPAQRPPAPPRAPVAAARPPAASARVAPPPLPTGTAPPVAPPPSRERPVLATRPAPSLDAAAGGLDAPVAMARPAARAGIAAPTRPAPVPRGVRPVVALRPAVPSPDGPADAGLPQAGRLAAEAVPGPDEAAGAARDGAFGAALDAAARDDVARDVEARDGRDREDRDRDDAGVGDDAAAALRNRDAVRPLAPRHAQARRLSWPLALAGFVLLLAVVGIGIAAYMVRDRPEQVVATRAATAPSAGTPGKTVDRAASGDRGAANADGTEAPADQPTTGVAVPPPVGQNSADAPASSAPAITVAQRAALLVDAPDEPQRVKTYVGTVVWHLDSVSPGQGQPLATAVKADVDIPDAKLKVTMLMQRNPEPQLPASHTIEFHFLPQPGNTLGNVKQVNVPEMRKDDDAPTGDPLSGVPVAITDNYFLVGLSRGAAEGQNLRLITERNWFDMSLLFVSGKLGKLTFEKGAVGQRTFEDAVKTWK